MSLLERVRTRAGLCVDCGAHEPIADGNRCSECLGKMLRTTRPRVVTEAAWLARARQQPHGLARPLDRSAA